MQICECPFHSFVPVSIKILLILLLLLLLLIIIMIIMVYYYTAFHVRYAKIALNKYK